MNTTQTSTTTRRAALAFTLAAALLGACATASGPQFSGLEAAPTGQAHL